MNNPPTAERAFLALFPAPRRSFIANQFLAVVRAGETDPAVIVSVITAEMRSRCARYFGESGDRYRELLLALGENPQEAREEAEHALWWESLTPDQQRHEKAKRARESFDVWGEAQPATDKQIDLLRRLGHTEEVPSKAAASRIIDNLLKTQRAQPQTAFGAEVRNRAGLDRDGGRR